jgi:excinuclease ABC subunit C
MRGFSLKFNFIQKKETQTLPKKPGVYCFKNKEILYIGKASNIQKRVKTHFQQLRLKESVFLEKTKKIGFIETCSEIEALILEANLIKEYQPKFNVLWKDDKNYFFVAITNEDFPRIFITHQTKLRNQNSKLKTDFIGPFVDGKALKQALRILRKIFPFRSCKVLPKRPCLWYQLNRCLAPCLLKSKIIKEIPFIKAKIKTESQKNARALFKILKGEKKQVIKELKKEMKKAAQIEDFEKAAKIRDRISALERILAHARIFRAFEEKIDYSKIEKELKKILQTKRKIKRIEAFDISTIFGKIATGSMVTFIEGKPNKNFYRRFKIKFTKKPNDVLMLKEVLSRRFKHREWEFPDLILVDGGKPQLQVALKLKTQNSKLKTIKIVALAKKGNKLFIENKKEPIFLKELPREIFNLILQLRDEAHRFAVSYHRKLRKKKIIG